MGWGRGREITRSTGGVQHTCCSNGSAAKFHSCQAGEDCSRPGGHCAVDRPMGEQPHEDGHSLCLYQPRQAPIAVGDVEKGSSCLYLGLHDGTAGLKPSRQNEERKGCNVVGGVRQREL